MMDNKKNRDVMDSADVKTSGPEGESFPAENMPKKPARPTVSPQEGGYFLNKFLEQSEEKQVAAEETKAEEAPTGEAPETKEELQANIVSALQEIYDPEIPVNIYELGLIYDVIVNDDFTVKIRMTLTTPHCPVAESMPGEVELKVSGVSGVKGAEVMLVWEPAWDMSMMSDEARLELGLL